MAACKEVVKTNPKTIAIFGSSTSRGETASLPGRRRLAA
jgi:hypothetical protein